MSKRLVTRIAAAAVLAACLAGGAIASPASAATLWSSGPTGYVGQPTGVCTYYDYWNTLDLTVAAPSIYAPNRYAGAGNDSAATRYQVLLFDRYGQQVRSSGFSGWAASYDNYPAVFSGPPVIFRNIPEFSYGVLVVQWLHQNYSSNAIIRLDRHVLQHAGLTYPYVRPDSCSKWKWEIR